jgi:hypothetical protein
MPVDVYINIGFKKTGLDISNQYLHFRGNRKLVDENSRGLRDGYRKTQASAKKQGKSGKDKLEKLMEEEFK